MSVALRACSHKQEDDTTSLMDRECSQWVQPLLRAGLSSSRHRQSITPDAVYQCLCFERQGHGLILLHPKRGYKVSLGYPSHPPLLLSPLVALLASHFILTYAEHIHIFISYDVMSWLVYIYIEKWSAWGNHYIYDISVQPFLCDQSNQDSPLCSETCGALLNALSDKQGAHSPFRLEHGTQRLLFSPPLLHSAVCLLLCSSWYEKNLSPVFTWRCVSSKSKLKLENNLW